MNYLILLNIIPMLVVLGLTGMTAWYAHKHYFNKALISLVLVVLVLVIHSQLLLYFLNGATNGT